LLDPKRRVLEGISTEGLIDVSSFLNSIVRWVTSADSIGPLPVDVTLVFLHVSTLHLILSKSIDD